MRVRRLWAGLALDGHRLRYRAMLGESVMASLPGYCGTVSKSFGHDYAPSLAAAEKAVADGYDAGEIACIVLEEVVGDLEAAILARVPTTA